MLSHKYILINKFRIIFKRKYFNEEPLDVEIKEDLYLLDIIPSKEEENAGYDIYACWENVSKSDKIIKPHQTKLIPTGSACALPINYYFQV